MSNVGCKWVHLSICPPVYLLSMLKPGAVMAAAMQRAMMAERLRLPESSGKVAGHTPRKVAPIEFGELRRCPTVADMLPDSKFDSCPTVAGESSTSCSGSRDWVQIRHSLADGGQPLAKFGHTLAKTAQFWSSSANA